MKLPRIVANQNIPSSIPGGYASADAFGAGAAGALAEGAGQVGRSAQRSSAIFAHAAGVLEEAKAKAEVDGALTTFKGLITDEDIALKEQGTDPDQYAQALRDRLKERATVIHDSLTSPLAKSAFTTRANSLAETKLSTAKYDALTMKNGLTRILEENQQTQDATAAVRGSSTEMELQPDGSYMPQAQAAFKRGLERGPNGLKQGRYTPAESAAMTHKFLASVNLGQMYKDAENPEMRPAVLAMLINGGYPYIDQEKQRQIAHTMQADSDKKYKDTQDMLTKWFGEQRGQRERQLYKAAADKTLTVEQLDREAEEWGFTQNQYAGIRNEMTKPLDEVASDPQALERVDIAVHASVPTMTERQVREMPGLNRKDRNAAIDRLISRHDHIKTKGDSLQMQRHNQAEQSARAAFNIPVAADKYEGNQGKVWAAYLRELTARSNAYDGQEDALKVNAEIVPLFKELLGEDARVEVDKLRGMLNPLYQTFSALKEAKAAGAITQGEYDAKAKVFIELNDAMKRQEAVDEAARKLAAERLKKDAEKKSGFLQNILPSFGKPPTNLPDKNMGRPK